MRKVTKGTVVLYYLIAVCEYLTALHPILDKTATHDIWDPLLSICIGTTFLCIGLMQSRSLKTDDNSDSDEK